jgi:hypothetical protein
VALFLSIHLFQFFASTLAIDQQIDDSMSRAQTFPEWHSMGKILPNQEMTSKPNERALVTTRGDYDWEISDQGYGWCPTGFYWMYNFHDCSSCADG